MLHLYTLEVSRVSLSEYSSVSLFDTEGNYQSTEGFLWLARQSTEGCLKFEV